MSLDVTSAEQRTRAVSETDRALGPIDILVDNAGIDFLGAIEEQREHNYHQTFEVNFFGGREL